MTNYLPHRDAMWITESWQRDAYPLLGEHLAFRRDYLLPTPPLAATIAITASVRYLLWVNGVFIETGPSRCYPNRQIIDCVDISGALRAGNNAMAVIVQRPTGISGYSLVHRMGLFIDGEITCADAQIPVHTDGTWQARNADWYIGTPFLCTIPLGFQEHVDGAKAPAHWRTAPAREGWRAAFCLGGAGTPPWRMLARGGTKKNVEAPCMPHLCWTGVAGRELADPRLHNLALLFEEQPVTGAPVSDAAPGGIFGTDEENLFVFDFGKTRTIRPGVEVIGLSGPVRFEFFYHLSLADRPHTMMGFGHEREGFCDSFVPVAGCTTWAGLTPRGFRFLTVKVAGSGRCQFRLRTHSVEYPYEAGNAFQCDDLFLQRVWDISAATLRSATTDVIGEPARENVLWTFDACVGGKAAYHTFGDTAMWKHCLELVAHGIDGDGIPNAVVPAGYSFMVLIDQSLYWVHSCKEYYWATGDRAFLAEQAPAIERLLAFCAAHLTADHLLIPPGYAWHWVDWAPLNKEPYSMPINGMFLMAAQAANALANEMPERFAQLQTLSQTLIEQLSRSLLAFFDEAANCFRSHLPAHGVYPVSSINRSSPVQYDLHSNALACLTRLGSARQRAGAVAQMVRLLEEAPVTISSMEEQPFGIAWTQLILEPLFAHGYVRAGLQYLRRYLQPFLDLNTATWGEDFVPEIHNTAHGWGACVNSLIIEALCGIRPATPGWASASVAPCLPDDLLVHYRFRVPTGQATFHSGANCLALPAPGSSA